MEYKDLTGEQKQFIMNRYDGIKPYLIDYALNGGGVTETDPFNGHEYVDMGEAGIWAKYPIGVTNWETCYDDVLYFEWGGIQGYTAQQVKNGEKPFNSNFKDYRFSGEGMGGGLFDSPQLTKYCNKSQYGKDKTFTDNLTILEPEDDAAHVNMGGSWRMPTKEEFQKLYDSCDIELVTDHNGLLGLSGRLFKLKNDESKQLFIPHFGNCVNGSVNGIDTYSNFWSSSLYESIPSFGFNMILSRGVDAQYSDYRYCGYSIIGILDDGI